MKPQGIVPGEWWALLRGPKRLPVLFSSRQDALDNCDPDEYLQRVSVAAANGRPLVPLKQKRKRGAFFMEGSVVDFGSGKRVPPYLPPIVCLWCRKEKPASCFVNWLFAGNEMRLYIGQGCNECQPPMTMPFVQSPKFVDCWDRNGKPIRWRQRTRDGEFGPWLSMSRMELRRMPNKNADGLWVYRPQPRRDRA